MSFLLVDALTKGGPHGTPKPIELHAHDPPRYIGDMLAWLHQSIPTESENLNVMLKLYSGLDKDAFVKKALGSITEDVCRPLKTRVEQVNKC